MAFVFSLLLRYNTTATIQRISKLNKKLTLKFKKKIAIIFGIAPQNFYMTLCHMQKKNG